MNVIIGGIDVLAWRAVLVQWTAPTVLDAAGVRLPKPEETWTVDELKKAKYNSKALSAIHNSVTKKTFELIQGYETAKEAWDLLQLHFEGTQKVQNSRKDMLATRFENLKMEEHESISDFSSKLKSLSQEAVTLGKRRHNTRGGILLESDDEDPVSLLARRFDRALRKVEQGQSKRRFRLIKKPPEADIAKMYEVQFYECKGFGHFKTECPTVKIREIRCVGCKGVGHTQLECVNNQKQSKRSSMHTDSEEDSEDEEELNNFVAFLGITEFDEGEELSESESDGEHEDDLIKSYKEVHETLIRPGRENTLLIQEKRRLEALVESIQVELQAEKKLSQESVSLMKEKLILATKADMWEKELYAEKEVTAQLQAQLDLQYKKIHMFVGTKQLDKILSYGRTEKSYSGLGYTGRSASETENTQFVSAGFSHPTEQRNQSTTVRRTGCYLCGKHGHIKALCYKFWNKIKKLRQQGKFFWNGWRSQIWVKKEDLLSTVSKRAPVTKQS
ncbi:hypothetical protein AALP_AA7G033400 [Arabis alpina]|uniref:CCHC-type domain-containing protein n=1 Tax=Arabis alpina TaxID=50452 RepID=A0A087GFN5_ARAAL|nr:hypothetical protein AALP_AA7G033400 [Arabis alpina]